MNDTIKKQAEAINDLTAENKELKKQLSDKKTDSLSVSNSPTADDKTVKYIAPTRTVMDAVYARRKLQDVEISASDKKGIKELEAKGYKLVE